MWCLVKIVNYVSCDCVFVGISDLVQVIGFSVGKMVKYVQVFYGGFVFLFVVKDEVDLVVEIFVDVWVFQCFVMFGYEDFGVVFGLWWQFDVVYFDIGILVFVKVVFVEVCQEFRNIEEFWDEFMDIGFVFLGS